MENTFDDVANRCLHAFLLKLLLRFQSWLYVFSIYKNAIIKENRFYKITSKTMAGIIEEEC